MKGGGDMMKIKKGFVASLIYFFVYTFSIVPVHAGNLKGWAESIILLMDEPLIRTLSLYNTQGFVLADAGSSFANFSYLASRIAEEKRGKNEAQNDLDLVLGFKSCVDSNYEFLSGNVHLIQVKSKIEESKSLLENYRELIEYTNTITGLPPKAFGLSKVKPGQIFTLWEKGDMVFEIQLNDNPHQIVYQANKACKKREGDNPR